MKPLKTHVTSTPEPSPSDAALFDRIVAFTSRHVRWSSGPDEICRVTASALLASCPHVAELTITASSNGAPTRLVLRRVDLRITTEPDKPFGYVEIVDEHARSGLYVLHIAPGGEIGWHRHDVMRERELIVTDGLVAGSVRHGRPRDRVLHAGAVVAYHRGVPHRYTNTTGGWQRVLCIDSPPFIPADEIMIDDVLRTVAVDGATAR